MKPGTSQLFTKVPTFALLAALAITASAACGGSKPPADPRPTTGSGSATASGGGSATGSGSAAKVAEAKPARDPALLTCKDMGEPAKSGDCGQLEAAPHADEATSKRVVEIWRRIEGPFSAMSGRETALVVLSPDARIDGKPVSPAAQICPGQPPIVYVPATLLALVDFPAPVDAKDTKKPKDAKDAKNAKGAKDAKDAKDAKKPKDTKTTSNSTAPTATGAATLFPTDFLAFVIGHELGHRLNDLTPDGCVLGMFDRPGQGEHEEELADARSAFFMTTAGFSASKVARQDMVTKFIESEYPMLTPADTKPRKDSLVGALARFDSYEALYQAALSLALGGEYEPADRLLTWADELVQSHGVLLPELRVMRAIARINRASKNAPWASKEVGIPVSIAPLKCTAIHPGHSGLHEEPTGAVRAGEVEYSRKLLKEALVLLGEAEARGATPFTVSTARMCAHLYLADATSAAEAQERAQKLIWPKAPAAVTQALADNRSLLTFLQFARKKPPPDVSNTQQLDAWADELAAALGPAAASVGLAWVLDALHNATSRAKPVPRETPTCSGSKPSAAAFPPLPDTSKLAHGQCPAAYKLTYALPSLDAAKTTGTNQGVTVCTPDKTGGELSVVRLPKTTEPPLDKLERTMITMAPPPGLDTLDAWACLACETLERVGVSDRGDSIYVAQCKAVKLDAGMLITRDGKVHTIVQRSL